ncbi:MAG: VCBS repeat-containing protein, partial [Planctomycetes bacterium]|nr:VCBS repeat-containing protein [Planctomycetota bacterium]
DLVSANYRSQTLYWVEHPGESLGPWTRHVIAKPGAMETGRLVDVDGDGWPDVLPNPVKFAAWWELARDGEPGAPRWIRHDLPSEAAAHSVGFGDLSGDGRGDIVATRGWLEAPEDPRQGTWQWHADFELHRDAGIPILVYDVDADGDNDLVWGRGHRIGLYWMEHVTDGDTDRWVRHAIDTSWSQAHSLLLADVDGDGHPELIAGKRYMGHDGKDLGEYDPLVIYWYDFDPELRTWRRGVISSGGPAGVGLDPKAVDLDADGDVDLIVAGRSGLFWFENLRISEGGHKPAADKPSTAAPTYEDHSELLVYRNATGDRLPVETPAAWALRRVHILANTELAMGPLPDPSRRVPLEVEIVKEETTPHYNRIRLTYAAEPGDRVPAYLLVPHDIQGKAPAMLCLHQTTGIGKGEPAGLGGRPTLHYAHELASRGYVAIVPDYPSFGDYPFDFQAAGDRYASGSMKAIWNNHRAVDLLETLPYVNPDRIGCIGHSLGGHNAILSAVFDQRLRAVVSSCGFTAFHKYYQGNLAGWTSDRYMPRIRDVYGNDPNRVPFDFHELVAALAPRPFFVNAPIHDSNFEVSGVKEVIQHAAGVYELLGAEKKLRAEYPDSAHDFPDPVREEAYRWLDRSLK